MQSYLQPTFTFGYRLIHFALFKVTSPHFCLPLATMPILHLALRRQTFLHRYCLSLTFIKLSGIEAFVLAYFGLNAKLYLRSFCRQFGQFAGSNGKLASLSNPLTTLIPLFT